MLYEINNTYDFPVIAELSDGDNYSLRVSTPKGDRNVLLAKLAFQKRSREIPTTIHCRVKRLDSDGVPVLVHDIRRYVHTLYEGVYRRGESIECTVASVPDDPQQQPYSVRDRNGIFYNLFEKDTLLVKEQKIRCKFTRLTTNIFSMVRVDEWAQLTYHTPEALLKSIGVDERISRIVLEKIFNTEAFAPVREEIATKAPQWPLTAATVIGRHINEWFLGAKLWRNNKLLSALLKALEESLLYLLEGSSFLNTLAPDLRRNLQKQLTELVEALEPYSRTLELIRQHRQDEFVVALFDKLGKSGYLYHPSVQFGILMLIFREYPAKVRYYLNRIFESIFSRDLSNWKREPFRSAFAEQFEIYVRQARRDIDALPVAETREQKTSLETIITAIALQLILADENSRSKRNQSLLYRYISLLRPLKAEALLSKSFMALMGVRLPDRIDYATLREPMMMMTQATVLPAGDILSHIEGIHTFKAGDNVLTVSRSGIAVEQANGMGDRVVPEGLMPWLRPQIYVQGVRPVSSTKLRSITDHQRWWTDIEQALFSGTPAAKEESSIVEAKVGEDVWIVIDGVTDVYDNDPTFLCRIRHEGRVESKGTMKRSAVVNYNLRQPSERSYRAADGSQLGFYARVVGRQDDGSYVFSLRDEVDQHIQKTLNYEDEYTAVVTGANPMGYSAISSEGIGLFLERDSSTDCRAGDVVHFRLRSGHSLGSIFGYITNTATSPEDNFVKNTAFERLMTAIGVADEEEDAKNEYIETANIDSDEILSADDLRELIEILRFKAISEGDIVVAYDYLRLCRILAIMLGEDTLADKLLTHAALLALHQYYATNNRIDSEELERLRDNSADSELLRMIFHRVELVSWLGKEDKNPMLYETSQNPATELEGSLAKLVLSFNMLHLMDQDSTLCDSLREQIKGKLNLNSEVKVGKYYGSESKYLEFKTSIVYPASEPGSEVRESPAEQQMHILSRIAGLLNADGGRLYIGVNNDGYAVGLHDDFKYFERHKAWLSNRFMPIGNIDNMCVFLENLIHETFGATVSRKIEVSVDNETDKDVILISVRKSLTPVLLEGKLYVRQSGQSTREYHGADIEEFVAERASQRAELEIQEQTAAAAIAAAEADEAETVITEAKNDETPIPAAETIVVAEEAPAPATLALSRWRSNILHEYDPDFVEPFGYLYFMSDNTVSFSKSDLYMEHQPDCRAVMTIAHELKDAFLVMAFEDERILKVPLQEIYERGENNPARINPDFKLQFVAIAGKDDSILSIVADSNSSLWKRAFPMNQIENGHISSQPRKAHESPINHSVAWEVIDSTATDAFKDCTSDKLGTRKIGSAMRVRETEPRAQEKIAEICSRCMPQ